MDRNKLQDQLIRHEDLKLQMYKDSVGKWTIGVGRNIQDKGISHDEAMHMLGNDIDEALDDAMVLFSVFPELDDVRQRVVVDMAFNMGRTKLKHFRRMIAAVQAMDFPKAADEMVDSLWYRQVGIRGVTLERMMRTGSDSFKQTG